jgi:hypothetical protein
MNTVLDGTPEEDLPDRALIRGDTGEGVPAPQTRTRTQEPTQVTTEPTQPPAQPTQPATPTTPPTPVTPTTPSTEPTEPSTPATPPSPQVVPPAGQQGSTPGQNPATGNGTTNGRPETG